MAGAQVSHVALGRVPYLLCMARPSSTLLSLGSPTLGPVSPNRPHVLRAEVERMPTLTEINADLQDLDFDLGWLESMENLSACAEDGLPAGLLAHSDLPHGPLREPGSSPLGAGPSAHMHLVPPPPVTPPQHGEGQEHAEPAAQLHSMPATAAQQPGTVPTFQQLQALSMVDRQRLLSARGALYLHTKLLQQVLPCCCRLFAL